MSQSLSLQMAVVMAFVAAFALQWLLTRSAAAGYWTLAWVARLAASLLARELGGDTAGRAAEVLVAVTAIAACLTVYRAAGYAAVQTTGGRSGPRALASPWVLVTLLGFAAAPVWYGTNPDAPTALGIVFLIFRGAPLPLLAHLWWDIRRSDVWPDAASRRLFLVTLGFGFFVIALGLWDGWSALHSPNPLAVRSAVVSIQLLWTMADAFAGLYGVFSVANVQLHRLASERERARHLEQLGRLTSGVAHDLNNVLASVALVAEELGTEVSDDVRDADLAVAHDAVRRGTAIAQSLSVYQLAARQQPEEVDLVRAAAELEPMLQRALHPGQRLLVRATPTAIPVQVDRTQLERVLLNLVSNARDAMATDGRAVVAVDEVRSPRGLLARLTVQDNGCGIPADVLPRVTEPFFTTKAPGAGSGLGLAMAHAFATESNGALRVDSVEGSGTSIVMHLPLAPTAVSTSGEHRVQ